MTQEQLIAFCDSKGIPYKLNDGSLQVMDMTLLPGEARSLVDGNGRFVKADEPQAEAKPVMIEPGVIVTDDPITAEAALAGKVATHEGQDNPADDAGDVETEESEAAALRGKLPDGFPGKLALEEAGITTYAQLRKERDAHDGSLKHLTGIGDATDGHISEAMKEGS